MRPFSIRGTIALTCAVLLLPALGCASAPARAASPARPLEPVSQPSRRTPPTLVATAPAVVAPAPRRDDASAEADSVRLITRMLVVNGASADRAALVAPAVLHASRAEHLDPLLVVGVIGVENPELRLGARSHDGAVGVMQVREGWKREIHDCGRDLGDPEVNLCFGTRILRMAIDESPSLSAALRKYNGCTHGARCARYVSYVYARAGRAMLAARAAAASRDGMADVQDGGAP